MDTLQDLASARATVQELCSENTQTMTAVQLLEVLDGNIGKAREGGDVMAVNILQAVRRDLRSKASRMH